MPRTGLLCAVVFLLNGVVGCGDASPEKTAVEDVKASATDSSTDPPSDTPTESPAADAADTATEEPAASTVSQVGSFRGVITFQGDVPAPRMIQATKDAEFCSAGEGEAQDVNVKDGKLSGAIVELTVKGKDLPGFTAPENGFVIRQKDCRFMPRLLVAYDLSLIHI